MRAAAGSFDRRIIVQMALTSQDAAGDEIIVWSDAFKRWAMRIDAKGREFFGAQQINRDADTAFEVRDDSESRTIAPESHRVIDNDRVFEIVSVVNGRERADTLILLCASSPALRGARAPVSASQ